MPGNKPAEAFQSYISPLQQSISCLTNSIVRPSGYEPDTWLVLTFKQPSVELLTRNDEILRLAFVHTFAIEKQVLLGYKIRTRSYLYAIEDTNGREIVAFHWHPETSTIGFPHLHIGHAAGASVREDVRDVHFRTDRIAFEDVALMLIDDFRVVPERDDCHKILRANLEKFRKHKTW